MTHLIADEKLGGIQREFIEVARKAEVGDFVIFKGLSVIYVVEKDPKESYECLRIVFDADEGGDDLTGEEAFTRSLDGFTVLEPTDIVVIDGNKYRLAERGAEVGEKVIVIETKQEVSIGSVGICTVNDKFQDGSIDTDLRFEGCGGDGFIDAARTEYLVLIPVKSRTCGNCSNQLGEIACKNSKGGTYCSAKCADESEPAESTPDIYDLLANLAERVTSLERIVGELTRAKTPTDERFVSLESQIRDTQRNVQTFAELAETTRLTKDDALHATIEVLCAHIAKTGGGR